MLAAHFLAISILFFSFSNNSLALPEDIQQPLNIEADQLLLSEKKGTSTYTGHVKISQGSLTIKGDKVFIQTDDSGLLRFQVDGSPASFQQLNNKNQQIRAQAKRLSYESSNGILKLNKDAMLEHNLNIFRAEKIIYDSNTNTVQAGQDKLKKNAPAERVFITIHPDNNKQSAQP